VLKYSGASASGCGTAASFDRIFDASHRNGVRPSQPMNLTAMAKQTPRCPFPPVRPRVGANRAADRADHARSECRHRHVIRVVAHVNDGLMVTPQRAASDRQANERRSLSCCVTSSVRKHPRRDPYVPLIIQVRNRRAAAPINLLYLVSQMFPRGHFLGNVFLKNAKST
jgi:hypothetical protein